MNHQPCDAEIRRLNEENRRLELELFDLKAKFLEFIKKTNEVER